jgi:hypothetical protein
MILNKSPRDDSKKLSRHFLSNTQMAYLNGVFVTKQGIGLKKYKQVMEHKLLEKLKKSL